MKIRAILGGLAALAALGLIGGVSAGAALWWIIPAIVLQIICAALLIRA